MQFEFLIRILIEFCVLGHSRTIMGVEQLRDGTITMLVLDPSHSPGQMMQFNNTGTTTNAMRLIRKSMASMKARQYQVVCVVGIIDSEAEYQVFFLNRKK